MSVVHKHRFARLGLILTFLYLLIVAGVYLVTALGPAEDGLEWMPFVLLAMPWYGLNHTSASLFFGLLANAGLVYLFGTLIARLAQFRVDKDTQEQ
jgi:hypothetical protein